MTTTSDGTPRGRALIVTAALFIVLAGLKAAASIIDPLLLAVFIAIIAAPAVAWLMKRGVPDILAVILVILLVIVAMFGVGAIIGGSIADFSSELPRYQKLVGEQVHAFSGWLRAHGVRIPEGGPADMIDGGSVFQLVGGLLSSLAGAVGDGFMILFTVLFILLEASTFPAKYSATFGETVAASDTRQKFLATVKKYFTIKTGVSLATGVVVGVFLWIMGVGYPVLWGLLTFLLNFVPTIGPLIALLPPALLALVDGGLTQAVVVALGIVIINTLSGNFIEPRLLGKGLGLSPLVVFLSLIVWGWILGPIGMILSIPLTVTIKIAMDSNPGTHWIGTLLGTGHDAGEQVAAKRGPEKVRT